MKVFEMIHNSIHLMLAFDIETTGLDGSKHDVTVVCTEDYHTGKRVAYEFDKIRKLEPHKLAKLRADMVKAFNEATSLCAFNGIRFDIPFLRKSLSLDHEVTNAWILKTSDILEACRLGQYGPKHTFGLNLLCEHNSIKMKISSGKEAIVMAHCRRWDDLRLYCIEDVRILCDLYRKKQLKNPRGYGTIDLTRIAHPDVYMKPVDVVMHDAVTPDKNTGADNVDDADEVEQLIAESIEFDKEKRISELEKQVRDLQAQLKIYTDFCTCI